MVGTSNKSDPENPIGGKVPVYWKEFGFSQPGLIELAQYLPVGHQNGQLEWHCLLTNTTFCGKKKTVLQSPLFDRATENLPGGSLKYQFVYLKIRRFKCSHRIYILIYIYIYIHHIFWEKNTYFWEIFHHCFLHEHPNVFWWAPQI